MLYIWFIVVLIDNESKPKTVRREAHSSLETHVVAFHAKVLTITMRYNE